MKYGITLQVQESKLLRSGEIILEVGIWNESRENLLFRQPAFYSIFTNTVKLSPVLAKRLGEYHISEADAIVSIQDRKDYVMRDPEIKDCHICGEVFTIDTAGIATHYDETLIEDEHVPYSLEEDELCL